MVRRARQKAVDKAVDKRGKSGGNRVEKQLVGVYKSVNACQATRVHEKSRSKERLFLISYDC